MDLEAERRTRRDAQVVAPFILEEDHLVARVEAEADGSEIELGADARIKCAVHVLLAQSFDRGEEASEGHGTVREPDAIEAALDGHEETRLRVVVAGLELRAEE